MRTFLATILSSLLLAGALASLSYGGPTATSDRFIAGTIEGIDVTGLRLTIKSDLGIAQSLPVASADVIKGLNSGDQVSVELDEQGRVMKVVRTVPEPRDPQEPKS